MTTKPNIEKFFTAICGAILVLLLISLVNRDYPYVGHDYRFFIARLVDTDLHIRLNGWSIQWYTPSFAGGVPAYPNPQHLEYSILQVLTYFFTAWTAILIVIAAASALGYYYFYKFLRERLEFNASASTLGALFFAGNGFYLEHMIAGHIGFQLFPLGSVILYILTDKKRRSIHNVIVLALLFAMMLYHAGFIILIILAFSLLILLPTLYLYKPDSFDVKRLLWTGILAVILAAVISGSKLYAALAFMQQFPRLISDVYNVSLLQALLGILAQLIGLMTFTPLALLTGIDTDLLSGSLYNITGAKYGIWELDISLSPVLLFFVFFGLATTLSELRKKGFSKPAPGSTLAILLLILAIWINLEMTLARGPIYQLTKQLPVLQSLHVNVRFTAVFILPIIVVGLCQMERFLDNKRSFPAYAVLAALTFASMTSYFFLSQDLHSRHLDVTVLDRIGDRVQGGDTFAISQILNIQDLDGFLQNASSYQTYEVLFGYSLEDFAAQTHPGSVFEVDDGYFNMTNPASLVFPELNNTHPFERIKVSERDKLDVFVQRGQPEWRIPRVQIYLIYISLAALLLSLGGLLIEWIMTVLLNREGAETAKKI